QSEFDEAEERAGWLFGRRGEAYIGLHTGKPGHWAESKGEAGDADLPYEFVVEDTDVACIVEMGSERENGDFDTFMERLTGAVIEGGIEELRYHSPSLGPVETGWEKPFVVTGEEMSVNDYPRFDNPYCQAEFGSREITIRCGEEEYTI
ncbi:MAG: hypothetical protein ACYTGH_19590, partial [Planctomycetota bacterium]